MLVAGCSDLKVTEKVAEGIAVSGAHLFIMKGGVTYNLYEVPDAVQLAARLEVLKQDKRVPVAVWVAGKRTI